MSLVVKLEDQLGDEGEWVILHDVLPTQDEAQFPILRGIDRFGNTVFNHLQMESFLQEWERIQDRAHDESQKDAWRKIKQMAEKCRDDRDLYLRFVGN